jgi:hypothetical protein
MPETDMFNGIATASFDFTRTMTVDDFVDMLATYSSMITASRARVTCYVHWYMSAYTCDVSGGVGYGH